MDNNKNRKILVVDDSGAVREILSENIKDLGYAVDTAEDGIVALKKICSAKFDLVITDLQMPEMDGFELLKRLKGDDNYKDIPVIILSGKGDEKDVVNGIQSGAEDFLPKDCDQSILNARIHAGLEKKRLVDKEKIYLKRIESEKKRSDELLTKIIPIGIGLFSEKVFDRLLEKILLEAISFCNTDGGTLYRRTENNFLKFEIVRTNSLGIALGGTSGKAVPFEPIPMYCKKTGEPNNSNIVSHVALTGSTFNIPDAYEAEGFNFSGTRAFDRENNYRSTSFLTVPLINPSDEVIGVLQLINAIDMQTNEITSFTNYQKKVTEILGRLATVALESHIREQELKKEIKELRIEINKTDRDQKVKEITESDYFGYLQSKIEDLKA